MDKLNSTLRLQWKPWITMCILIPILFTTRVFYGEDTILSGDEIGVGVVQAVGKWDLYAKTLPVNEVVELNKLREYYTYSADYTIGDVLTIMRNDRLHPPLYFTILHFVIAVFGTQTFILKLCSILFSLGSVIIAYHLAKILYNEKAGLLAAFFISLSSYCLEYSVMVRLYPLEMFLSLLSTYILVLSIKRSTFHFRSKLLYLYIIVCAAGLYTYYSFSVILLSQSVFAFLSFKPGVKTTCRILLVYLIIFLLLVPWIVPFFQGLDKVKTKDLYFKGSYSILFFFQYFSDIIFFPFRNYLQNELGLNFSWEVAALKLLILFVFIFSTIKSASDKYVRNLLIATWIYFFVFILNDKIFETSTMVFDRQHYYSVPIILLLLAGGLMSLDIASIYKRVVIFCFIFLLFCGLVFRFNYKSIFDGPYYFSRFSEQLAHNCSNTIPSKVLILYNVKDKRYVLPLVHTIDRNYRMMIVPCGISDSIMAKIGKLQGYKNIVVANVDVVERKRKRLGLKSIDIERVKSYLSDKGFVMDQVPYTYQYEENLTMFLFTNSVPDSLSNLKYNN